MKILVYIVQTLYRLLDYVWYFLVKFTRYGTRKYKISLHCCRWVFVYVDDCVIISKSFPLLLIFIHIVYSPFVYLSFRQTVFFFFRKLWKFHSVWIVCVCHEIFKNVVKRTRLRTKCFILYLVQTFLRRYYLYYYIKKVSTLLKFESIFIFNFVLILFFFSFYGSCCSDDDNVFLLHLFSFNLLQSSKICNMNSNISACCCV